MNNQFASVPLGTTAGKAIEHLTKADKAAPRRDDVQYALAAARSLQGNAETALEHLKTAITLRPENRFLAQHDDDFEPLRSDPRFGAVLAKMGLGE